MSRKMLIGGSFGQYINVEKAVADRPAARPARAPGSASPWDRFQFLGNTAIRGAYMALLRRDVRAHLTDVAGMMTYLELSADNSFYDAFTSALFLPHTDMAQFPSVEAALDKVARLSVEGWTRDDRSALVDLRLNGGRRNCHGASQVQLPASNNSITLPALDHLAGWHLRLSCGR